MNTPRWIAQNEDGTYAVGEGNAEIATCKNREDAMRLKEANAESVAWLITDHHLNELQIDSIQRLINRAKHAHMTDIKLRINGQDEWHQADWLKHLTRTTPPQRKPLTDEEIEDIWADCSVDWDDTINVLTLARAIEQAHGIKGET